MSDTSASATTRPSRWPWVVLGLGLVWTVLLRVPLIINAEDHLDSDLAVDGLTLIDAVNGQWRWHYPGTPHMGILPLFFSYPQALVWGANAFTLVSGGTLIWVLIVAGTFALAWRTYGPTVAGWAILPLIFSSTGTIWLSGRITGGHLLTLAWHILALAGLYACLSKGGLLRAAALGFWCGLGLYLDMMFLFTLFGLLPAALLGWLWGGRWRLKLRTIAAFLFAMLAGYLPHEAGRIVDPYDAYPSQFVATVDGAAIKEHARLLEFKCLPRLIAGTELTTLDSLVQRDGNLAGNLLLALPGLGDRSSTLSGQEWLAVLLLAGFMVAFARLLLECLWGAGACERAIAAGTCLSAVLIVGAFLLNRNIFNSDNYRYLIYLIVPWSLGFGLVVGDLAKRGPLGIAGAVVIAVALASVTTDIAARWYQDNLHYFDDAWRPVSSPRAEWSKRRLWAVYGPHGFENFETYEIPSDVTHVFGGYWDVYRMAFLSGKRLSGIPYPIYPNRFANWSRGLGSGQGRLLVLGVRIESGTRPWRSRQSRGWIEELYDPASRVNWRAPFGVVWRNDGRDAAELDRIRVVIPSADGVGK